MSSLVDEPKFTFVSQALDKDALAVVNFRGTEGLSRCYQFEINLVSSNKKINLKDVLQHPATLTIKGEKGDLPIHGILSQFEIHQEYRDFVFYRAVLAPKLWWLTLARQNQVFLNKTVPEIIEAVLKGVGLTSNDYEMKLSGSYSAREYVCQYRAAHFDFISYWMEREGLYFYFDHSGGSEKMVITDSKGSHTSMSELDAVTYSQVSGLDYAEREEIVSYLYCRQFMVPEKIILNDYNYASPTLNLKVETEVSSQGRGEFYLYGEHYAETSEGQRLAKVRQEGYLCREQIFSGEGTVPFIRSGYEFTVKKHFRNEFNQKYLTIEVQHQGSQASLLNEPLSRALSKTEHKLLYRNMFSAIPADVQFRPEPQTPKARFHGTLQAKIDAEGSGQYAVLDSQGRYKVILPFDLSGRSGGKASYYLRLMTPYGGSKHGFHFPLVKGTEVLIAFTDGDPDRPVIIGTAPNPEHPSLITSSNQTQCQITTLGQNKLHFFDQKSKEMILMESPAKSTYFCLGSKQDKNVAEGITINTEGQLNQTVKDKMVVTGENDYTESYKGRMTSTVDKTYSQTVKDNMTIEGQKDFSSTVKGNAELTTKGHKNEEVSGNCELKVSGNNTFKISGNHTENISGNHKQSVSGKKETTVDGDNKLTTMGKHSHTAMNNVSKTYLKDLDNIIVGQIKEFNGKLTHFTQGNHINGYMGKKIDMSFAMQMQLMMAMLLKITASNNVEMALGTTVSINLGNKIVVHGSNDIKVGEMTLSAAATCIATHGLMMIA